MIRAGYYIKTFLLPVENYLGICVAEGIAHADLQLGFPSEERT